MEITGPIGAPLNGYGDRLGRGATGVHDPIWARAVYLDDGTTQVFLVSADLCLIHPDLRERVLALAPPSVSRQHVILTATHTHNGQGGMIRQHPFRVVSGRFMPDVLESTASGIAQAMHEAYNRRRRAAIGYGVARQTDLSTNRRYPGGPIDEQIGVILVEDADGNAISVIGNFAAHPTSVPETSHYEYSADYPGYFYSEIEHNSPEGCVAMFLNGAEGNQTIAGPGGSDPWSRTENTGRILAKRVLEAAASIACTEAELQISEATAPLPPSLASAYAPTQALLQTLEFGGLLMAFYPGEPCVELGLSLRKLALERGYQAQFSVGLANDYLMYFVSREHYADFTYESACTNYGPGIGDWFNREFGKMMKLGTPPPEPTYTSAAAEELPGATLLRMEGDAFSIGRQQGERYREAIVALYQDRVLAPLNTGALLPKSGNWAAIPSFINPAPLALPALGMAFRKPLTGISPFLLREMEGMAEGVGLPFDAIWLLQNAAHLSITEDTASVFQTPLCTIFAAAGDRAGADRLLVGRNLDWSNAEVPVVSLVRPSEGLACVLVGFAWNSGLFTGMNEAGLVLALEGNPNVRVPADGTLPIEFTMREALRTSRTVSDALSILRASHGLNAQHILLAGLDSKGEPEAVVLSGSTADDTRAPDKGLLLGTLPSDPHADADTIRRYVRVAEHLDGERIVGRDEMERVLTDGQSDGNAQDAVWNTTTKHSVIFVPKEVTAYVAFPQPNGRPGPYTAVPLKGAASNE